MSETMHQELRRLVKESKRKPVPLRLWIDEGRSLLGALPDTITPERVRALFPPRESGESHEFDMIDFLCKLKAPFYREGCARAAKLCRRRIIDRLDAMMRDGSLPLERRRMGGDPMCPVYTLRASESHA